MDADYWEQGEPCNHAGCLSHVTHPCEGCGRVAGRGRALVVPERMAFRWSAPVYVDKLFTGVEHDRQAVRVGSRHGHRWCHMWSEDLAALHEMARKLGMRREWFQDRKDFPHYDLVPTKRAKALQLGAVELSLRDYLSGR